MKQIIWCVIIIGLMACTGNTETKNILEQSIEDTSLISEEISPEDTMTDAFLQTGDYSDLGENLQIDDYVEYLIGGKVGSSFDDSEAPSHHFFQELDIKGGYAEITGAYEGGSTYALWRMSNGDDLIGITTYECGPVCSYTFEFRQFSNGTDKDVTETVLPVDEIQTHFTAIENKMKTKYPDAEYPEGSYMFVLPKKGTSLELYMSYSANDYEFPILTLTWDKEKFSIDEKFMKLP